jgi:hypothetical protein
MGVRDRNIGHYGRRNDFDVKFILLAFFIAVAFIKNSGCSSSALVSENNSASSRKISSEKPVEKLPLTVKAGVFRKEEGGMVSAIISVNGGKEPYAYFLEKRTAHTITFIDSHHAKVSFREQFLRHNVNTVYVLDAYGDISAVPIIPEDSITSAG